MIMDNSNKFNHKLTDDMKLSLIFIFNQIRNINSHINKKITHSKDLEKNAILRYFIVLSDYLI